MSKLLCSALFGLASVLCFSGVTQAAEFPGLYSVDLPVSSQQLNERKRASSQGLARVIQRVTGDTAAFNEPLVRAALQTPERYLQQFSYYFPEVVDSKAKQHLRLLFDEALVNQLLRQAKQPIWGSSRPSLMMWVAVEGNTSRHLISATEKTRWQRAVNQAGRDSGVPILLPLMDLQDESNISLEDVWGLFRSKFEMASKRYRAKAVLGGRIYQTSPGQWAGRWLLIFEGEAISFATNSETVDDLTAQALAQVTRILVKHYAIDTSNQQSEKIKLAVRGVKTLQDYARVMAYLDGFAMVQDVAVSVVEGEQLTFLLTTEGGWSKLKSVIALDKTLMPVSDVVAELDGDMMAVLYQWNP